MALSKHCSVCLRIPTSLAQQQCLSQWCELRGGALTFLPNNRWSEFSEGNLFENNHYFSVEFGDSGGVENTLQLWRYVDVSWNKKVSLFVQKSVSASGMCVVVFFSSLSNSSHITDWAWGLHVGAAYTTHIHTPTYCTNAHLHKNIVSALQDPVTTFLHK